jgi:hypothetical protein
MKVLGPPMSGSSAGVTAAIGGGSQVLRRTAIPVQPLRLSNVTLNRQNFGQIAQSWQKLTAAEQQAWVAYAQQHPTTNTLGQQIILSGFAQYMAVNNNLAVVGLPSMIAPSATTTKATVANLTVTSSYGGDFPIVNFDGAGPAGSKALISACVWQTSLGNKPRNFTALDTVTCTPGQDVDLISPYNTKFGMPPSGAIVWCKVTPISVKGTHGTAQTAVGQAP